MRIVVAGGTGFIGRALVADLVRTGHEVIVLTRQSGVLGTDGLAADGLGWDGPGGGGPGGDGGSVRFVKWDPAGAASGVASEVASGAEFGVASGVDSGADVHGVADVIDGADAVVNLAGATIASRWTRRHKERIVDSRVYATRALVEAMKKAKEKPPVFVSASAVGFYGPCGDEDVTEASPSGHDFLAGVCRRWEAEALRAAGGSGAAGAEVERAAGAEVERAAGGSGAAGDTAPGGSKVDGVGDDAKGDDVKGDDIRVVLARFGLVLGEGGALRMMALPFRLFVGGPLGSGRQWMPWIHRDDAVGMVRFAIQNETVRGPLNVTGPEPMRNRQFAKILGRVMGRPAFVPAPAFAMRAVLGEMADMVLTGQRALPEKATAAGYRFRYEDAESALRNVLGR